jgi:hypothetical protein
MNQNKRLPIVVISGGLITAPPKFSKETEMISARIGESLFEIARLSVPVIITAATDGKLLNGILKSACGPLDYLYMRTSLSIDNPIILEEIINLSSKFFVDRRLGIDLATRVKDWQPRTIRLIFFADKHIPYLTMVDQEVIERLVEAYRCKLKDELKGAVKIIGRP